MMHAPAAPTRAPFEVKRFQLGPEITAEQQAHLDTHGFLIFDRVVKPDEIAAVMADLDRVEKTWIAEGRRYVNGIPIFYGKGPRGEPYIQRFPFMTLQSEALRRLVHDARFEPVRRLIGENTRIGDTEKDGAVISRYIRCKGSVYPRLGWHTDGLRDLFYGRMPKRMLNVGIHFDDCAGDMGGLRVLPGTHDQGFADMLFRKPYFVSHGADPAEVAVETRAGDLTIHDGRTWHRVEPSKREGYESVRRVMYVPYLSDAPQPKHERSPTPAYHRLSQLMCFAKRNGLV
jgi:phytanoyl-CoA hydroxylase